MRTLKALSLLGFVLFAVGCMSKPYLTHKDFNPMVELVDVAYPVPQATANPSRAAALNALQAWQENTDQSILAMEGAAGHAETVLRHNTALDTDDMNRFTARTKEVRLVTETVGQLGVTAGAIMTGAAALDTAGAANRAARAQETSANAMMVHGGKPKQIFNMHTTATGGSNRTEVGPVTANAETGPVTAHGGAGGTGGTGGAGGAGGGGGDASAWQFQGQQQQQQQQQRQNQNQDQSSMNTNNNGMMMPMPGAVD